MFKHVVSFKCEKARYFKPLQKGILILIKKEGKYSICLYDKLEMECLIDFDKSVYFLQYDCGNIVLADTDKKIIFFNTEDFSLKEIKANDCNYLKKIGDCFIVTVYEESRTGYTGGVLKGGVIAYTFPVTPYIYAFDCENYLITSTDWLSTGANTGMVLKNRFERYDIETGEMLWQLDVSELGRYEEYQGKWVDGKAEQIFGVYEGDLIAALGGSKLLFVDVQTGGVKGMLSECTDQYTGKVFPGLIGHSRNGFMDSERGVFYIFNAINYVRINLHTKQIEVCKDMKQQELLDEGEKHLNIKSIAWDYPCIYFTAESTGGNTSTLNKVGMFNVTSEKIEWLYEFPFKKSERSLTGLEGSIQYHNGTLCVLDSAYYMHVFERTNLTPE